MSRRARFVAGAAAALALVAPTAAGAQGARGEPVVGGGSFNTAPLLEAGSYSDTILPSESTFYRVELEKGQRLEVEALFDTTGFQRDPTRPDYISGLAAILYRVRIYTPLRQPIIDDDSETAGDSGVGLHAVSVRSPLALGYEDVLGGDYTGNEFVGPGTYYIRLFTNDLLDVEASVEIPTEIRIAVTGTPQESSRDYTPPLIAEAGSEEETAAAPEADASSVTLAGFSLDEGADDPDDGPGVGGLAVVAVYALLGGGALGALVAAIGRDRRRRPAGAGFEPTDRSRR